MKKGFLERLQRKIIETNLLKSLSQHLSASDLNSFLLHVFQLRSENIRPTDVLKEYESNRFVQPSTVNNIELRQLELELLTLSESYDFDNLVLSPLAPFGTCSSVATVSQDKVVTALRRTEVVADATNVLALESAIRRKKSGFSRIELLATAHRHIRAQPLLIKGHTSHFSIFCLTSAGNATPQYNFEETIVFMHFMFYLSYFENKKEVTKIRIAFKAFIQNGKVSNCFTTIYNKIVELLSNQILIDKEEIEQDKQNYYQYFQAKIYITVDNREFEIGDCGFTDWTQKLTNNNKERFFISAIGTEFLLKIMNKEI